MQLGATIHQNSEPEEMKTPAGQGQAEVERKVE